MFGVTSTANDPFGGLYGGAITSSNVLTQLAAVFAAAPSAIIRKNYAGIGFTYDAARDAFIPPKPFDSWLLNEDTCQWEAPVPHPADEELYSWNEELQQWEKVNV